MQEKLIPVVKIACYIGIAFSFVRTYFVCKTFLLYTKQSMYYLYKKELDEIYTKAIGYALLILIISVVVLYIIS